MNQQPYFKVLAADMFEDNVGQFSEHQCYLRLWAAKLVVHVRDYQLGVKLQNNQTKRYSADARIEIQRNFKTADMWIHDPRDGIGTFAWVCGLFNVDPQRARRVIKESKYEI